MSSGALREFEEIQRGLRFFSLVGRTRGVAGIDWETYDEARPYNSNNPPAAPKGDNIIFGVGAARAGRDKEVIRPKEPNSTLPRPTPCC